MNDERRKRIVAELHRMIELVESRDEDHRRSTWFAWEELDRIREAMIDAVSAIEEER
jgi:hypothetical protein